MIKIEHLNKYYNKGKSNEIHVINDTNLELPNIGLITFLGESGSGKTTLLNVIGGLDKATGIIEYDDIKFDKYQMNKIDKYRNEHIGYVFQNYNLINDISVYDNLKIALEAIDIIDKQEVDKRIEYALKAVGLYKYKKKQADNLSGGQMQRVSIARALIKNSKIIIADEPTGNLDSENTIEIMNILKKISEKSLVLLVTHDKNIAEFYSDQIIEIKDGKIINIRNTDNNVSLNNKSNKIYLKDLKEVSNKDNNLSYKIYSNNKIEDLELTIVEENNQIYLKSNKKIKLLEDTSYQLVDEHYQEIKKDNIENSFDYDTSWYNDKKEKNVIKKILNQIKQAFKNYFQTRKLAKFFHLAFILIGVALAFLNMTYSTYTYIDTSNISYDNDVYGVVEANEYNTAEYNKFDIRNYNSTILQAMEENYIDLAFPKSEDNYLLQMRYNSFLKDYFNINANAFDLSLIENDSLLCGNFPSNENEIVLGKKLADKILNQIPNKKIGYNFLIGKGSNEEYNKKIISGITSKDTYAIYYNNYKNYNVSNNLYDVSEVNYTRVLGYKDYEKGYYDVVYGNDLTDEGNQFLINIDNIDTPIDISDYQEYLENVNNKYKNFTTLDNKDIRFEAVGLIKPKVDYVNLPNYIANKKDLKLINVDFNGRQIAYSNDNVEYEITEGRDIKSMLEGLVCCYNDINIGEKVGEVTIVGKYRLKSGFNENYKNSTEETILLNNKTISYFKSGIGDVSNYDGIRYFTTKDINKLKSFFKEKGYNVENIYKLNYLHLKEYSKESRKQLLPILIVLVTVVPIYTYFSMRSKMIKDIYNIGVNRELGFSKKRIIEKYVIETIVLTLFTSVIGYLFTTIVYGIIANFANTVGFSFANIFLTSSTYVLLILLLLTSAIIGIIPIVNLLRKTPSEIVAKYDI